ncbi:carbohydrate sulfotransferase 3-like isoform X1 [Haliotis rufescens]|uniref:carbohydrate sulfotransferase 3-like isoform X1 n=2 Tax=Haliotis rufescens TaxID=6454 RepID=UPI00201F6587|nr:carbohydrate sulfotransferase 3-like isoform X1 [Haliotis rufescens]
MLMCLSCRPVSLEKTTKMTLDKGSTLRDPWSVRQWMKMLHTSRWFWLLCALTLTTMGITVMNLQRLTPTTEFFDPRPSRIYPNRTRLLISTYLRSGSTLTGAIIQSSDEVFYVFEPLLMIYEKWRHSQLPLKFFNQKSELFKNNNNFEKNAIKTVEEIWNCSFENIDLDTLTQFHMQESKTTKAYFKCTQRNPGVNGIVACLPDLKDLCRSRRINSQKVVRLPLRLVSPLMQKYPDLKIIHLVRDPRASILSQYVRLKYFQWSNLQKYAEMFCARIHEDLGTTANLARTYPGRIKLVRYETMAEHPLHIAEDLYQFVDLTFTKEARQFVYDRTLSGKKDSNCVTCLVKSNASVAANKWRTSIGLRAAQAIDAKCGKVYTLLGYKPVKTIPDLKNLSHSLKINDIKFAEMSI